MSTRSRPRPSAAGEAAETAAATAPPPAAASEPPEFHAALREFQRLLDRQLIDAWQPTAESAVYTTFVTVWLMVYQRLRGCPLTEAVAQLLQHSGGDPAAAKRLREQTLSPNSGAYSRARTRLLPSVARDVAQRVSELVMGVHPAPAGRRVFLLDGTTVPLAPTPRLQQAFPPQRNQHGGGVWPILHLLVAHELESGCAIHPECGPKNGPQAVGEAEWASRLIPRLPADSVVLGDRNFGVFAVAYAAHAAQQHCLLRLTDQRFEALRRQALPAGSDNPAARRWRLTWRPSPAERRKHGFASTAEVDVWLHEIDLGPLTLRLVTTLPDSAADLAALYGRRQDVETDIRDIKLTLNLERLTARSPEMLEKELALGLVAFNLVVQVRRLAARQVGVPPRKLGFKGVWGAITVVLLHPGPRSPEQWERDFELTLRIASYRRIPPRPGRSYPRAAHPQRNKSTTRHGRKPK